MGRSGYYVTRDLVDSVGIFRTSRCEITYSFLIDLSIRKHLRSYVCFQIAYIFEYMN